MLAESLRSTFGAVILTSYGMTECMPISSPPQVTNERMNDLTNINININTIYLHLTIATQNTNLST